MRGHSAASRPPVVARPWLRVTTTAVADDDADIWGWSESHTWAVDGSRSGRGNGFAPFQIADDGPIALVTSPRPIIDPDHGRRDEARTAAPPHDAQQRIVAYRQHQPLGKGGRWNWGDSAYDHPAAGAIFSQAIEQPCADRGWPIESKAGSYSKITKPPMTITAAPGQSGRAASQSRNRSRAASCSAGSRFRSSSRRKLSARVLRVSQNSPAISAIAPKASIDFPL